MAVLICGLEGEVRGGGLGRGVCVCDVLKLVWGVRGWSFYGKFCLVFFWVVWKVCDDCRSLGWLCG